MSESTISVSLTPNHPFGDPGGYEATFLAPGFAGRLQHSDDQVTWEDYHGGPVRKWLRTVSPLAPPPPAG